MELAATFSLEGAGEEKLRASSTLLGAQRHAGAGQGPLPAPSSPPQLSGLISSFCSFLQPLLFFFTPPSLLCPSSFSGAQGPCLTAAGLKMQNGERKQPGDSCAPSPGDIPKLVLGGSTSTAFPLLCFLSICSSNTDLFFLLPALTPSSPPTPRPLPPSSPRCHAACRILFAHLISSMQTVFVYLSSE